MSVTVAETPTSTLAAPPRPPLTAAVDLSVAIVNYRSADLLQRCLATWAVATAGIRAELHVIDNGTHEDLATRFRAMVPNATFTSLPRSIGFGAAVNRALARARGRHIAILNPDTLLGERSLTRLVQHLDAHEDVGVVGPRVWDDAARTSLQRSFRSFPGVATALCGRWSLLSRLWPANPWTRRYLNLDRAADAVQHVDWVSGCCMVIRGSLFRALGGLDERYPMFCEDVDLCRAAANRGVRVAFDPGAEIVHFVGGSRRRAPLRSTWLRHRSIARYVGKYHSPWHPWTWCLVAGVWLRFALQAPFAGRQR